MKKIYSVLTAVGVSLSLGGCAAVQKMVSLKPEADKIQAEGARTKITKFSDSLKNLGRLAETYKDEPFKVTVLPIENKSAAIGKLPNDITVMVESAINSIGSTKIIAIPYDMADPAAVQGDYFYIRGAITEFDTIKKKSSGFNAAVALTGLKDIGRGGNKDADMDMSAGSSLGVSSITIDFNMVNARTNEFIPGVHTKNTMKITDVVTNSDIGFSIAGSGFGINGSVTETQGTHAVIRLLVELSMVELIGKLRTYPYWIAVHDSKIDRDLLEKMQNDFRAFDKNTQTIYIQHLLSIIYDDVSVDSTKMAVTNKRIIEFKRKNNVIPYNEEISTELYTTLLTEIPKILTKKGWNTNIKRVFSKILNY